jgi:hypothetical protein
MMSANEFNHRVMRLAVVSDNHIKRLDGAIKAKKLEAADWPKLWPQGLPRFEVEKYDRELKQLQDEREKHVAMKKAADKGNVGSSFSGDVNWLSANQDLVNAARHYESLDTPQQSGLY